MSDVDLTLCRHRDWSSRVWVPCACPDATAEPVDHCVLYGTSCSSIPVSLVGVKSKGINFQTHRLCVECMINEEGYEKGPSD